jgi:hypothetical protein
VKLDSAYDPMTMIDRKGSPKNRKGLDLSLVWYHSDNADCLCLRRENVLAMDESRSVHGLLSTQTGLSPRQGITLGTVAIFFFIHHIDAWMTIVCSPCFSSGMEKLFTMSQSCFPASRIQSILVKSGADPDLLFME